MIHGGKTDHIGEVGFSAVERKQLLLDLQRHARELGVELFFQREVPDPRAYLDVDLVIGSDGLNSAVRRTFQQHFGPHIDVGSTRFTWLGTDQPFDRLTSFFERNEHGCWNVRRTALLTPSLPITRSTSTPSSRAWH